MKWLDARRKREAKANYDRGYGWAAGILLAGGTKEQVECDCDGTFDSTPFDEGGMDALRAFLGSRSAKRKDHKVYDSVWVMRNNIPAKMVIYGVSEEMNHMKTGTDLHYLLAASRTGAVVDECHKTLTVFSTREELVASL